MCLVVSHPDGRRVGKPRSLPIRLLPVEAANGAASLAVNRVVDAHNLSVLERMFR